MTTPAQPETPATGPDAPATGEQTPQQPTPPATPAPDAEKPATGEGEDWKGRAREWEKRSKANKQQVEQYEQQMAALKKALGLETEEDLPEHAQQKLNEAQQRAEEAEARAVELAYENTVTRIAATVNADPEALLDSGSFRDAVAEELGDDFGDADLRKAVEKVAKEYAKRPRFAKTSAPAKSGSEIPGGPPAPPTKRPTSLNEALRGRIGGGSK